MKATACLVGGGRRRRRREEEGKGMVRIV